MERIEWLNARDLSSIDYEPKREPGDMQCHKWARASEPCNSIATLFIKERSCKAVFSSCANTLTLRFAACEVEFAALFSSDSCFCFVSS